MKTTDAKPRLAKRRASLGLRGYTMVEVMMALAVLAIGGTGVISLQKATVISSLNSRNLASATVTAASWIERGKAQSAIWTAPPGIPAAATLLSAANTSPTVWSDPPGGGGTSIDGAPTAVNVVYCTQVRGQLLGDLNADTMRFEARTMFARTGRTIDVECADMTNKLTASPDEYGVVYLTGTVKRNTL